MPHIVLTEEQARIVEGASESVEVRDPQGRLRAFLKPLDPAIAEVVALCKRRHATSGPRIPSEEVQVHLRKLEEIRQREGMDEAKMLDLLRRMQAGEQV
jgi:hypothetical protein